MGVRVVRFLDAVAGGGRGGDELHVARDDVETLARGLALIELAEKLLNNGVPSLWMRRGREKNFPEVMVGHVGETGLADGVAVEEGEDALG